VVINNNINNPGQVNVGHQQVNMSRPAGEGEAGGRKKPSAPKKRTAKRRRNE